MQIVGNIKETRQALKLWGEYMRAPTTSDYRLGHPGVAGYLSTGVDRYRIRAPIIREPSIMVKKIIDILKQLESFDARAYMALLYRYHYGDTIEEAAKHMNVSVKTYKHWEEKGVYFVAGKLI